MTVYLTTWKCNSHLNRLNKSFVQGEATNKLYEQKSAGSSVMLMLYSRQTWLGKTSWTHEAPLQSLLHTSAHTEERLNGLHRPQILPLNPADLKTLLHKLKRDFWEAFPSAHPLQHCIQHRHIPPVMPSCYQLLIQPDLLVNPEKHLPLTTQNGYYLSYIFCIISSFSSS